MSEEKRRLTREEVAKREIGHTEVSPRVAWGLTLLFLATVFVVPVGQHVYEIRRAFAQRPDVTWDQPARYLPRCYDIFASIPRAWEEARQGRAGDGAGVVGLFRRVKRANDRVLLRDINEYTDALKDDSILTDALLPPAQRMMTRYLGVGNEQVYVGRDGWLFYRPGVDYVTGPGFLSERHVRARRDAVKEWQDPPGLDPVGAILDFARQLGARGIRLILVPTPVKAMVHPEKLSARFEDCREALRNPSFATFCQRLQDAGAAPHDGNGVLVFDPAPVLFDQKLGGWEPSALPKQVRRKLGGQKPWPLFLQTDTHWRPETMNVVAYELSLRVRRCLSAAGADPEGREAYVEEARQVTNAGDVAAMVQPRVKSGVLGRTHAAIGSGSAALGLDRLAEAWATDRQDLFPPETVSLRRVLNEQGSPWRPDRQADVLLLGDSFSNTYSSEEMGWGDAAGLAERLSFYLQRRIDTICRNDAGAHATREILAAELRRGSDRLAGKKVVIWQFAARELAVGDWEFIELKLGSARTRPAATKPAPGAVTDALELAAGETATITGRIAELKISPKPGTVPYKDHIMPVHLVDVRDAAGRVKGAEGVVLIWGLRNNRAMPAAQLKTGQVVTVRVRRWEDVEGKYATINTSELDDVDFDVNRFWCEELK